jgi:hypothetical protein
LIGKDINDGQASMPFWTICGKVDRDTSIVKLGRIAGSSSYLLVHFLILYTCIESQGLNYGRGNEVSSRPMQNVIEDVLVIIISIIQDP